MGKWVEIYLMVYITQQMVNLMVDRGYYEARECINPNCKKIFYCKLAKKKPKTVSGVIIRNRNCHTCCPECSKELVKMRVQRRIWKI